MVSVPEDDLGFPPAARIVDTVHGSEVRADYPLCSFYDPLELLPRSQGSIPIPHCDAADENVFN